MPAQLFTFIQMELPWELGPADGRYLLRKPAGPEGNEPQHVVVLSTVGAERKGLLGGRSRTKRTDAEPARVPVARATIVDAIPLSVDSQARAWLEQLDPEHEAQSAARVLNRVLFAHRIAGAVPHLHEVSPTQALVIRAGFGEGEQVADGLWTEARELLLSRRRAGKRASALRPQERLAVLLSGRGSTLLCEELVLRARLDLDAGRLALAAIELDRAYVAALVELPAEKRSDLQERVEELEGLLSDVQRNALIALPANTLATKATVENNVENTNVENTNVENAAIENAAIDSTTQASRSTGATRVGELTSLQDGLEESTVRHALERLEAALRARTALGFSVR